MAATTAGGGGAPGLGLPEMIPSQPPGIQASPKRAPMYAGQGPSPQPLQMAGMLGNSFAGGNRTGQTAATGNTAGSPHYEIARDIGQQVEQMILQAKHSSETKVIQEIQKIKGKIDNLKEKIQMVSERVSRLDATSGSLLKADLQKSIAKLEEVWEGEVGTLKHELWQTIQAHNHNADLMKTHKDAIDSIQVRTSDLTANPELEQIHKQLIEVDKHLQREQTKQQQTDDFIRRLTAVQQQLQSTGLAGWGPPGMPFPGMGGMPPGIQAMPGANAPPAPAGKKAQKKGAKAKAKPSSFASANAQNAQGLRAEAPEFVPTGWEGGT